MSPAATTVAPHGAAHASLRHRAGQRVDLWLALFAGPASWVDPERRATTAETATAALQLVALATICSWAVIDLGGRAGTSWWELAALFACMVALVVFLAGPTMAWAFFGRRVLENLAARPRLAAGLRALAVVGAAMAWVVATARASVLAGWPFGLAAGCEATLSAWAIGLEVRPFQWWRRFLLSGPHLGSVLALLIVLFAAGPATTWRVEVALYATLHLVAFIAALTMWLLERLRGRWARDVVRHDEEVAAAEAKRRAHWLHDEVCTRLGFVQRQVEQGLPAEQVAGELRLLDHALRERQLEELLVVGSVELAEVVQPYLRMAQQQGVRLVEVPRYEETARSVPAATGRLAKRVLANLVGNAVKAGANELALRLRSDGDAGTITLEVEDDAGGFDLADVQPGRGLDRLRNELGPSNLSVVRTDRGACVSAVVRVEAATPHPSRDGAGRTTPSVHTVSNGSAANGSVSTSSEEQRVR